MGGQYDKDSRLLTHLEGLQREGSDYPYTVEDIKGASGVIYIAGAGIFRHSLLIRYTRLLLKNEQITSIIKKSIFPLRTVRPCLLFF